jgi:hypothetical protein
MVEPRLKGWEASLRQVLYPVMAIALVAAWSGAADAKEFKKIRRGETVGAQTMSGDSKLVNKGRIQGGSDAGITGSGGGSKTIVNKGTISGSTGIKISGGGSVRIVNNGTITGGVSVSGGP